MSQPAALLAMLPPEDEHALALAIPVALPIIRRLINNAISPAGTPNDVDTTTAGVRKGHS